MAELPPPQPPEAEKKRPDESMTLLRQIMERPRDGAYAEVQPPSADAKRSWVQEITVLVLTIAIGTGGVWAARQLRAPVESTLAARSVLEEQIRDRSAVSDDLRREVRELRAEIGEYQSLVNPEGDSQRVELIEALEMQAGTSEVEGPGIVVSLTEPAQPIGPEEHVLDVDLQIVVNGLWAAGAEAISINNRRLVFGTAIRTAGEVILVDLEPVQSPYEISAIGDPDRMSRAFQSTSAAEHMRLLNSRYRIAGSIMQVQNIHLPAGNAMKVSYTTIFDASNVSD